jgi:hypothetical protein
MFTATPPRGNRKRRCGRVALLAGYVAIGSVGGSIAAAAWEWHGVGQFSEHCHAERSRLRSNLSEVFEIA